MTDIVYLAQWSCFMLRELVLAQLYKLVEERLSDRSKDCENLSKKEVMRLYSVVI